MRDTRRFYATLPLANTLGRLTRVGIGPLSLENEKQQVNDLCPNLLHKIVLKPPAVTISEVLSGIITFLYAFFACAVVASRRRAGRWSSPPAPRRARAPAASTPHAHDAASFRNLAAPARTDDRRTNDATCGPQEWLTGTLHDGGIRSVRSPLRRAPLLATPIATPLQCGRPERSGLLFLKLPLVVIIVIVESALKQTVTKQPSQVIAEFSAV